MSKGKDPVNTWAGPGRQGSRRVRVIQDVGQYSRTKQSFGPETDFNLVLKNYQKTGQLTHVNRCEPLYGDFSEAGDLQTALDAVGRATEAFAGLSAKVRDAAANSPVEFLNMMHTPEGVEALEAAGLVIFDPEELVDEVCETMIPPEGKQADSGESKPAE